MKSFKLFITFIAVLSLSACQKDRQGGSGSPLAGDGKNTMHGPSDGGGGDTCNGKMIESFKVDITSLDEFKEFIQPIMDKVAVKREDKKKEMPLLMAPFLKNWYLIDCKLQDIPKERKGLYLETYQAAIHTNREIFIDSTAYNSMAKEEKAKLLLHEIVMGYYLLKYLSLEEICKMANTCTGEYTIANKWKMFKPETYRPLSEEDHQKIRNITAWLWQQKSTLNADSFSTILKNNDFDKRFEFSSGSAASDSKEIEVDVHSLLRMFKKYQWSKAFPKFCQFSPETNVSSSICESEITADIRDYHVSAEIKIKQIHLKVKITRNSDKKVFEQDFSFPLVNEAQKVKLHITKIGSVLSAAPFALTSNWPTGFDVNLQEGLKSQMIFFMLNLSDKENPEMYQIIFQNYVWYSFSEEIVKKDGMTLKQIYGYPTLINEDSETIFVESELPFTFSSFLQKKVFIKATPVSEIN